MISNDFDTTGRGIGMNAIKIMFIVGVACLMSAGIASAADAATPAVQVQKRSLVQIFTFLFLMLGPFKIIGPFIQITNGADARLTRQIAIKATLYSSLALLMAGFMGEFFLARFEVPLTILALSGGLILVLVALVNVLAQFKVPASPSEVSTAPGPAPSLTVALTPLAFPTIVTPYGIAIFVVFIALGESLQAKATIGAIALAIMLLNLIVMLVAKRLPPVAGVILAVLGAVLGVLQVAVGLLIIHNSLKVMGFL